MKRTFEIGTVAVILVLIGLAGILVPLLNIGGGAAARTLPNAAAASAAGGPNIEQIQATVRWVMIGTQALGLIISLLAAFGLWRLKKWGFWLGIILGVLYVLSGLPMFFNRAQPVSALVFSHMAAGLIVLILLLLKDTREVIFPERR